MTRVGVGRGAFFSRWHRARVSLFERRARRDSAATPQRRDGARSARRDARETRRASRAGVAGASRRANRGAVDDETASKKRARIDDDDDDDDDRRRRRRRRARGAATREDAVDRREAYERSVRERAEIYGVDASSGGAREEGVREQL